MRSKNGSLANSLVPNVDRLLVSGLAHADPNSIAREFLKNLDVGPLAVAVSGGSDSLGVLHLLHQQNIERRPLICLTVDHQLRSESQNEAHFVGRFCAERGIEHHILTWQGPKPKAGLQKQAREARYKLMADVCKACGAVGLVTGHTLDDQFETITMRQKRKPAGVHNVNPCHSALGQFGSGLSGMAPATLFFSCLWVLRPFLTVRKAQIRDVLVGGNVSWIEDPSNDDTRFERVRVRQSGQISEDFQALANAQARRAALSEAAAQYIKEHCQIEDGLFAAVKINTLTDETVLARALVAVIDTMGGRTRLLTSKQLVQLRAFIMQDSAMATKHASKLRMNMGRALLTRKDDIVTIEREYRGFEKLQIAPRSSAIWDGRFLIQNDHSSKSISVAYDKARCNGAPCFWRDGTSQFYPLELLSDMALVTVSRYLNRFDEVLPSFDLKLANAVSNLLRDRPFQRPPWS